MPVWVLILLKTCAKALLPIIWQALVKAGVITSAEADLLKAGTHVLRVVESVKTYSQPSDYPNAPQPPVSQGPSNGNYNK